jgi:hypothetical protein
VEGALGVVLGFSLSEGKEWLLRRRRRKANWGALKAEVKICADLAERFLKDNVAAPLYRLPRASCDHALPPLLADASADETEVRPILLYYTQVDSLNRGLDQAEAARGDDQRLSIEHERNIMKARMLVPAADGRSSYYNEAFSVLERQAK